MAIVRVFYSDGRERDIYERNPLDNEQIKVRLQTKSIKMNKTYNFNEPN